MRVAITKLEERKRPSQITTEPRIIPSQFSRSSNILLTVFTGLYYYIKNTHNYRPFSSVLRWQDKGPAERRKKEAQMMRMRGSVVLFFALMVMVFSSCTTLSPHQIPPSEEKEQVPGMKGETSLTNKPSERVARSEDLASSEPRTGEPAETEEDEPALDTEEVTNQELIDSALEFCQASNDYWERGDLDNAVAALDKSYSLILRVKVDDDPDLLQQKEDLRFTISKRIVEVYASRFTTAAGDHNAIPLVMNDHVRRELESFKGRERDFFLNAYARSGRFRPAIAKALKEAGMPEELSWLPLIESGFKVRALSRARALGMWQFIASTGYRFGLQRDQWIDERMDPQKSTAAAIAYLKELHQMFGDWTTALAAYNCGEMTVMNRIRTQRINYLDNFWDLYEKLPSETAAYVPRLLAVLHIVKDPKAYGMELPPLDHEIETDEVSVNKQVLLKDVAARLGVDSDALEELNAELRLNVTPDGPYTLKVPAGKGERLLAMIDDIPTHCPPKYAYAGSGYIIHRVRSGDSLSTISKKYRTSMAAIMDVNGLKKNHILRVGSKLKVPVRGGSPSVRVAKASVRASAGEEKPSKYMVKKGDSLWQIAAQYKTTAKEIQTFNGLKSPQLSSGQVLMIPSNQGNCPSVPTKSYTVQGGDSPYLIAKKYEMELADFLKLNHLTSGSTIFPGQTLAIKGE
jgi:membrane-bound lytic murein transglycosylase D